MDSKVRENQDERGIMIHKNERIVARETETRQKNEGRRRGFSFEVVRSNSNQWGLSLVILSSWGFFAYFWLNGNKTLGMAVWNIEIYSLNGEKITIKQISIRFLVNILILFLAGLPLIQIYFSQKGLAINDTLSKTALKII